LNVRRFRLFVLLLAFTACRKPEPGVHVDPALATFTPSNATALAQIDFDQLKKTALYQRHPSLWNVPGLNSTPEEIGLDPRRDISSMVVFLENNEPVVLFRGTFSRDSVERKLLARGGARSTYRDHSLLTHSGQAIFFPTRNSAAAGATPALRQMIDDTAASKGISDDLRARLRLLPSADQVWFALNGTIPAEHLTNRSDIGSILTSLAGYVNGAAGGVGIDDGIHLQVDMSCISEKGAQQVHDALRGMLGFARLSTRDNQKDMLRVYDAIQVTRDASMVHLHADLAPDLSDELLTRYLPGLQNRANRLR
jgi:hypothetical protein